MPRKEKSPKKKTKEKSPKKRDLLVEDPAMQEADINRLLQNALDQANAGHEGLVVFSLYSDPPIYKLVEY